MPFLHIFTEGKKNVFWEVIIWVLCAIGVVIIADIFGNFGWLKIIKSLLFK